LDSVTVKSSSNRAVSSTASEWDDCLEGISGARYVGGINSSLAPIEGSDATKEVRQCHSEPRPVLR